MSDKVKGYRVSDDVRKLADRLYEASGMKNEGEWFESVLNMVHLQEVGKLDPVFQRDIKDFEKITNRLYYLFINMLGRSRDTIEEVKTSVNHEIEQKEGELTELRATIQQLNVEKQQNVGLLEKSAKDLKELEERNQQLERTYHTQEELLREYKGKITILESSNNALMEKFTEKEEQVIRLQETEVQLLKELELSERKNEALLEEKRKQEERLQNEVNRLKSEFDDLQAQHKNEMQLLSEKKETEKQQAILTLKQEYTDKYSKLVESYADKIKQIPSSAPNLES